MAALLDVNADTTSIQISTRNEIERSKKPMRKNKQSSPSPLTKCYSKSNDKQLSTACPHRRSSSLSLPEEFEDVTQEATLKQSLLDEYDSLATKSNVASSSNQMAKQQLEEESGVASLKVQSNDRGISWRWLRNRKGIRTKKLNSPAGRKSIDGTNKRLSSRDTCSQSPVLSSEEDTLNEVDPLSKHTATGFGLSVNSDSLNCQQKSKSKRNRGKHQCHSSTSLSSKYQPKLFEDIAGHEIIVKALSNAVQKEKIAPLYVFHGPSGSGKTSIARIFSMALNCESTTHIKPCRSCRGCTRSLYIMDLCSGSRISGFERIKTLFHSTTFTQIIPGFKVFIIEECHSLMAEAWDEILNIVETGFGSSVVFIMITEDVNMVPKGISSKCQKFCFPKLKDADITLKLARIVTREEIEIDREALRLITSKAEGSMREAENILDQLALLSSRITSLMVQHIVGLVPHNKLLDLLTTVLSADTIKTVRSTRELIASGVQPRSILSQLASLITDILSGAAAGTANSSLAGTSMDKKLSRTGSQLSDDQSEKLSNALKMLVEAEKQLSSSNEQTNWVVAALLQIKPENISNRTPSGIVLPRDIIVPSDCKFDAESRQNSTSMHRNRMAELLPHSRSRKCQHAINSILEKPDIDTNDISSLIRSMSKTKRCPSRTVDKEANFGQIGNMEEVWKNMLERIQSQYVREFLYQQGKIASLTISSANAIVHLMFKRPEDKLAAQMSGETIESALKTVFGCPVTVNMSLEPIQIESNEEISVLTPKGKETECSNCIQRRGSAPFLPPSESLRSQNAGGLQCRNGSRRSSAASDGLRTMRLQGDSLISQSPDKRPSKRQEENTTRPQQILPFSGPLTQGNVAAKREPENAFQARGSDPVANIKKNTNLKHMWLSLSSIPHGDASVEGYSQDLLFENENKDRKKGKSKHSKLHSGSIKDTEEQHCQHSAAPMVLNRSWSCNDTFCRRKTNVKSRRV